MAKARTLVLGVGCLLVLLAGTVFVLVLLGLSTPSLPSQAVLSIHLSGPIPEIVPEDPLSGFGGVEPISLREIHEGLTRAAEDDRIVGVRLRVDDFAGGFAVGQEIRGLVARVRAAGKWTAAYLDTAGEFSPGNSVYLVASACDEISLNPAGDVNLIGYSARSPFMRGTFDKLGIEPEFPGRGDYKTARFLYTRREFTPAHREMTEWLLGSLSGQLVEGVAGGRGSTPDEVRALVENGPFLGDEAVAAGLVDHLEDWGDFDERMTSGASGRAEVVGLRSYLRRAGRLGSHPRIAVVTAVGTIMRGPSGKSLNPLFGGDIMGSDTIARAFRDARAVRGVRAVIFRIDSGGGSAVASEIIRQEMVRTAEQMPVIVSMSNVAASGGYWISCGAQKVLADPGTITGSIGVYAGHLNMDEFWSDRLGVTFGRVDFGPNANLYGSLESWTDDQRALVDRMLDRIYDDFLERVASSRDLTVEQVDAVGRGRVWTGVQALEHGLVDELGGFSEAVAAAKELAGIDSDARVELVDLPRLRPWWQEMVKRRSEDEAAIRTALEDLDAAWRTGTLDTPGVVWMPPIYIQ